MQQIDRELEQDWPNYVKYISKGKPLPDLNEKTTRKLENYAQSLRYNPNMDMVFKIDEENKLIPFIPFINRSHTVWKYRKNYGHVASTSLYELMKSRTWWRG
ncbi:hypothetical protein BB559_007091 [Furculomyces boomerangus]|uniref:Integrase zinc-binding domain-containing protein n=1 Tax=Furculomyces boomerangus TaxID=61424 RepID=A0A2T9XZ10_9FUNG|nr:hypothetical protein BB559_007091 [Furculomyces boomerangus]